LKKICSYFMFIFCLIMLIGCKDNILTPPASTPVFISGYQIHKDDHTFVLEQMIRPVPGKTSGFLLIIDGVFSDNKQFLLAQKLRILDSKTGDEKQSFSLSFNGHPFEIAALPLSSELSGELVIEDLNFDGYSDFRILMDAGTAGTDVYHYWVWNNVKKQFDQSAELESLSLCNPEFDATSKTIASYYADSAVDSEERIYRYIGGKPKMTKWTKYHYDSDMEKLHVTTVELREGGLFVTESYRDE